MKSKRIETLNLEDRARLRHVELKLLNRNYNDIKLQKRDELNNLLKRNKSSDLIKAFKN
jgi:hypothetical protein